MWTLFHIPMYNYIFPNIKSQNTMVSIMTTDLMTSEWLGGWFLTGIKIFLFSVTSRLWVWWPGHWGDHSHPSLRWRIQGTMNPLPHMSSWDAKLITGTLPFKIHLFHQPLWFLIVISAGLLYIRWSYKNVKVLQTTFWTWNHF